MLFLLLLCYRSRAVAQRRSLQILSSRHSSFYRKTLALDAFDFYAHRITLIFGNQTFSEKCVVKIQEPQTLDCSVISCFFHFSLKHTEVSPIKTSLSKNLSVPKTSTFKSFDYANRCIMRTFYQSDSLHFPIQVLFQPL